MVDTGVLGVEPFVFAVAISHPLKSSLDSTPERAWPATAGLSYASSGG